MPSIDRILEKASSSPRSLSRDELASLLSIEDERDAAKLYQAALSVREKHLGRQVHFRGIVEMGNACAKDCFYCGIRKSNKNMTRFMLSEDDACRMLLEAYSLHYGSAVLQSGEIESEEHTCLIERIIARTLEGASGSFGITLSLGEQTFDVFRRWHSAGARRYLLRIETSDRELYSALHPASHSFERRVGCLDDLKRAGYQTGTGVMIGLPGQTLEMLASDVIFFGEKDVDMIGMGPYIPHKDTPLGKDVLLTDDYKRRQLFLGLKMIACVRLYLHDVNIASTTALQALSPNGREQGLLAGANVIMPNVTDTKFRKSYLLYEGKPGTDENAAETLEALEKSIASCGFEVAWDAPGDPLHFFRRTGRTGA